MSELSEIMKVKVKVPENADEAKEAAATAIQEVGPVLEHAKGLEVVDQATYKLAMEGAARCSRARARVEEIFGHARDLANQAHKAITGAIKSLVDPLKQAETIYGGKAYQYDQKEKARLQAEELARREKERQDKADEKLSVASFLEAAGANDVADRVIDEPIHVTGRKVTGPEKPVGVSVRENWQWELVDLKKLVAAVAEGKVPLSVLTTDGPTVTKMVKALKSEVNLPGINVWDAGTVSVRKNA